MSNFSFYDYMQADGAALFTAVCLPHKEGCFPTVIYRSPYVDHAENMTEQEICDSLLKEHREWLENGYAVVFQHCRGRGKSSGDCVPYIYEREDGLALQAWIREQSFYNGELFLYGRSYLTSVHLVTVPFASDIKGAILEVQDSERYNCNYRNGFYKIGLHGGWYVGMYKRKSHLRKSYTTDSYRTLPLSDFSKTVFGESVADFDEILRHPKRDDPFWQTRFGGGEARGALDRVRIPVLLVTGFYDIYTGGIFDMWNAMDDEARALCALAVDPFDHSGTGEKQPICFENGELRAAFENYKVRWMDFARGKCEPPLAPGKITYYKLFGDRWCCDDFYTARQSKRIGFGEGTATYKYNPYAPATFKGGLSANFGGNAWQDPPHKRYDVITRYSDAFDADTLVKGKITGKLCVRSDCEDTCFYVRLSLCKPEGDYGLRDDITQISNFNAQYCPGTEIELDLSFDEHAFVVKKGERIRMDISSSAYPHYVPHTNEKGLFSEQKTARVATNTVISEKSFLLLPIEENVEVL